MRPQPVEMSPMEKAELAVVVTKHSLDYNIGRQVQASKDVIGRLEWAIRDIKQYIAQVEGVREYAAAERPDATERQITDQQIRLLTTLVQETTQQVLVQVGNMSLGYQARGLMDAEEARRNYVAALEARDAMKATGTEA